MKVALVCIAKNEDNYIEEWIRYYNKLGFDDIFIYQNNWKCDIKINNVHIVEIHGIDKQQEAYNNFIKENINHYDWAAFFDVDEFLVLKKHKNIKDFINDYNDYPAIGVNWVFFGDNNIKDLGENYSVLERFTKRQFGVNRHVKSIIKLIDNIIMDIHSPKNQNVVATDYKLFSGPFNYFGNDKVAQLNHYFCKTEEEFVEKCERGRADDLTKKRTMDDFHCHNFNHTDDYSALNFLKVNEF